MTKLLFKRWLYVPALVLIAFACSDDEGNGGDPVASFQYETDDVDFLTVHFTNFSKNADSYSWNFGDGSAASAEEEPSHTYEEGGTYTVVLSATGNGKTVTKSIDVIVTDPNEALKALTGETSKSWKLLRDVSTGRFPMAVGPADRSTIWWSFGGVEQLGVRPCALNDEYIFSLDGGFEFKTNGDFWAEGMQLSGCQESLDANFVNGSGADVSAWNDGEFDFTYNVATQKLTLNGTGAHLALFKAATDAEVDVPQPSVTYDVIKLHDGEVDTLIVETKISTTGYWRFVLVHYDNPLQEPAIPGSPPTASFTTSSAGAEATFTNSSTGATSYSWDFGDNTTSTAQNPVHTYAQNGIYMVTLTSTNASGTASASQLVVVGASNITLADLHGGGTKTWKLKPMANAYRVGTASVLYFGNPAADVAARACMFDDEFKFSSDMKYAYDSKGQVFAEPYILNIQYQCTNDNDLTGIYAGFRSNNNFTYGFTDPAGSNLATVTVNGTGAFIGFNKGYNGGEYSGTTTALATSVTYEVVNFTKGTTNDTMEVRVQINTSGDPVWWSMILISQ